MAHEIDFSNNRANIAYRGQKPWHSLGFAIEAGDSPEVIAQKAGVNFEIKKATVLYKTEAGVLLDGRSLNKSVLYRSDTNAALSVMSTDKFKIHQPAQIFDFIASSARAMGWEIETAGSLKGGRKIWALANLGEESNLGTAASPDVVKGYLLAATSCDGSMASEFLFTSVRVVCDNTLHAAVDTGGSIRQRENGGQRVKVYHFNALDVSDVKKQLGIAETVWGNFIERAKRLTQIKLDDKKAIKILRSVYEKRDNEVVDAVFVSDEEFLKSNTSARKVLELYQGGGIGSGLKTAKNTAWGLVNAQTEYSDHASKTWSVDNRLNSAWFGKSAQTKQDIVDACFVEVAR